MESEYEKIDGRRSPGLVNYARIRLEKLANEGGKERLLDLGCGSGFVSRTAQGVFDTTYAVDISQKILQPLVGDHLRPLCADSDFLPFKSNSFNSVAAFAVLHHFFSFEAIFKEVYRVLKPGGLFYSDHDMDSAFYNRFTPLIALYRTVKDPSGKYIKNFKTLTQKLYDQTEYYQKGIPTSSIHEILKKLGFKTIHIEYHWYGLFFLTNFEFFQRQFFLTEGKAPLVRIVAIK